MRHERRRENVDGGMLLDYPACSSPPFVALHPRVAAPFADERRIVAGDEAGLRPMTVGVREAGAGTDNAVHSTVLIATFRCAAPARGAFVDERRVIAATKAAERTYESARPWSRRSPRAFAGGARNG